ncbi:MAG: hypothetical protein SGPRY_014412, partial [Prymnesium sp.]
MKPSIPSGSDSDCTLDDDVIPLPRGSLEFIRPPEQQEGVPDAADIGATSWCLGVLLFYMLAGYPPFARAARSCQYFRAYQDTNELRFPHTFSRSAVELICGMLHLDPAKRLSPQNIGHRVQEWGKRVPGAITAPAPAPAMPSLEAKPLPSMVATKSSSAPVRADLTEPLTVLRAYYNQQIHESLEGLSVQETQAAPEETARGRRSLELVVPLDGEEGGSSRDRGPSEGLSRMPPIPCVNSPMSEWPRRRDLSRSGSYTGLAALEQPSSLIDWGTRGEGAEDGGRGAVALRLPRPPCPRIHPYTKGRWLKHLGWDGLHQPAPALYDAVKIAFEQLQVPYRANEDRFTLESLPTNLSNR